MARPQTVKVSSRYQIAVPSAARKKLGIQPGDKLLVDVQDGLLILMPEPEDIVAHMTGLGKEIWEGLDVEEYIRGERGSWEDSQTS